MLTMPAVPTTATVVPRPTEPGKLLLAEHQPIGPTVLCMPTAEAD